MSNEIMKTASEHGPPITGRRLAAPTDTPLIEPAGWTGTASPADIPPSRVSRRRDVSGGSPKTVPPFPRPLDGNPAVSVGNPTRLPRTSTENATVPVGGTLGTAEAPAGPRGYDAYMQSEAWRNSPARLEELRLAEGRCRLCARGAPDIRVEVHHRSYRRFGRELPSDLCVLCAECHLVVTAELRRRRYEVTALPPCSDTPRVLRDRVLHDLTWRMPDGA